MLKTGVVMASMLPEVVFFYGPPFPGKTLFYAYEFFQTHERISPQELFDADPSLSLRAVILKVVNVISKGQSVVLDDENSSRKSRKSFLNILRNKVPYCSCRVVHFQVHSSDGFFLCEWAREWQLAHQFECLSVDASFKVETVTNVDHWFNKRTVDLPDKEEGFSRIDEVEVQLICDTPYKFIVPALFLQWEGLFEDGEQLQCNAKEVLVDIINKWRQSYPCGRVIMLHLSSKQSCPEGNCECVDNIKRDLHKLTIQTAVPVYFVHFCSFSTKFSRPPHPGLFAWLQRLHSIDLSNKGTFYVCSSDAHYKAANAAGVKCIKANKLLQSPQMINAVHVGLTAQVPHCVKQAKLAWFSSQIRPSAIVPLFQRAKSSHAPSIVTPQCVLVASNERVHGVCFKDFAIFDSFNSHYQQLAVPTKPASGDIFKYKVCSGKQNVFAKETMLQADNNTPPRATKVSRDKTPVRSKVDKHTMATSPVTPSLLAKHLAASDIESLAFSPGHFRRGEDCVRLIRNVTTSTEQDGVLFAAKCLGSQGQLYDVSALLNQKGIVRAICTCADPASKLGKCKHAVGLLLWCKNEKNMIEINQPTSFSATGSSKSEYTTGSLTKPKKTLCDDFAEHNQEDEPVGSGKGKSLPKWMSPLKQTSGDDREKRTGDAVLPVTLSRKRIKMKKCSEENTFYCLTPEELLQTAEEILQGYHGSLDDQQGTGLFDAGQRRKRSIPDRQCDTKPSNVPAPQAQRDLKGKNVASPGEEDVLIAETCTSGTETEACSGDLNAALVIPETVAVMTTHSHNMKGNSMDSNKPSLLTTGETCPLLTNNKVHGKSVTASVLDDFI